jgi:small subunit ribosomal protein S16
MDAKYRKFAVSIKLYWKDYWRFTKMAVRIRLKRIGSKKKPFYRVVVADERAPRDGRFIEEIGHYNPMTKDLTVDNEKAQKWIGNGAQPTDTVRALLKKSGAIN